ncbi:MAG TPA: flagellar hook capping FlgD N-terminal domain-containing protein [Allosphingosinicella sp.]|jgi:flagellar basal-body rod modification protein FlgD
MALAPISSAAAPAASPLGLDFQSLLKIILTQLTYQDPLKPVDNFQFVSQLAQFSQLQQGQVMNDQITSLLSAQAANQATGLLGRTVDFGAGQGNFSGVVKAISFANGQPEATIETASGQSIAGVSIANISQVR